MHPAVWKGDARLAAAQRAQALPPAGGGAAAGQFADGLCGPAAGRPQQPGPDSDDLFGDSLPRTGALHRQDGAGFPRYPLRHGGGQGDLPAGKPLWQGADGGLRHQSRLRSFRCAGKRGGDVLHRQRLSGIQRGAAGGGDPGGAADRAVAVVRRLSAGGRQHEHHAGRRGGQRRIPLPAKRGACAAGSQRAAR